MMKKMVSLLTVLILLVSASLALADHGAVITYIHGIPGLPEPVDVYANGNYLFSFDFAETEESLDIRADQYLIEIVLQGRTLLAQTVKMAKGKNYTAVAHSTYDDRVDTFGINPGLKLSIFENEVKSLKPWASRLTLRHTADAPEFDIALRRGISGNQFFVRAPGLSNNYTGSPTTFGPVDLWRGYFTPVFFLAGTDSRAYNHNPMSLARGFHYIVYSIGSMDGGSFRLVVQAIDLRPEERETH
jgi:hypothetical protein